MVGPVAHGVGEAKHLAKRGEIRDQQLRIAAGGHDRGDCCLAPCLVPAVYQHAGTGCREPFGNRAADTVCRSGDERRLVCEFHVQSLLCRPERKMERRAISKQFKLYPGISTAIIG